MKIYTKVVFGPDGQVKEEESYEYSGPMALCLPSTITDGDIYWGPEAEHHARVFPTGADFSSVAVTYPTADAPYFSIVLTLRLGGTITIASTNLTLITPTSTL